MVERAVALARGLAGADDVGDALADNAAVFFPPPGASGVAASVFRTAVLLLPAALVGLGFGLELSGRWAVRGEEGAFSPPGFVTTVFCLAVALLRVVAAAAPAALAAAVLALVTAACNAEAGPPFAGPPLAEVGAAVRFGLAEAEAEALVLLLAVDSTLGTGCEVRRMLFSARRRSRS
jgi:hypothetical protein